MPSTCAISVIRLTTLTNASVTLDITWAVAPGIWSLVELTCGLACAGIPTLRPLISSKSRRGIKLDSGDGYQQTPYVASDLEGTTVLGSIDSASTGKTYSQLAVAGELETFRTDHRTHSAMTKDTVLCITRNSALSPDPEGYLETPEVATALSPPPRRGTEHSLGELPDMPSVALSPTRRH